MPLPLPSLTENSTTVQNPSSGNSLGDVRGGGSRVTFGGIGEKPGSILVKAVLAGLALLIGAVFYFKNPKP